MMQSVIVPGLRLLVAYLAADRRLANWIRAIALLRQPLPMPRQSITAVRPMKKPPHLNRDRGYRTPEKCGTSRLVMKRLVHGVEMRRIVPADSGFDHQHTEETSIRATLRTHLVVNRVDAGLLAGQENHTSLTAVKRALV